MKMLLYQRFKIDVLWTSQGRHTTDFCSGRFEDVRRTLLQNFKNKQQLGFKYFSHTHLPIWIENNTAVMCFLSSLRLGDVPRTSLCRRHFRTHQDALQDVTLSLQTQGGPPWDVSPKVMRHCINLIVFAFGCYAAIILLKCYRNKFYRVR